MNTDTPLTDREEGNQTQRHGYYMVKSDFARGLERENARLKADGKRLVYLLEIEEDSEMTGKSFRPNKITSCRAMDGKEIDEILQRMKNA